MVSGIGKVEKNFRTEIGLSNTMASIVMLQSSVLFPDCFFVQSQEKETVLVFVLPLLCGIFYHVLGPSILYQGLV